MASDEIEHKGDTWRILITGARRLDGTMYVHLSSSTRFELKGGVECGVYLADWIEIDRLPPTTSSLERKLTTNRKSRTIGVKENNV